MKKILMIFAAAMLPALCNASAAPGMMPPMGRADMGMPDCRMMMPDESGMNDKQCEQLDALNAKHFLLVSTEQRKLVTLERELRNESLKNNPDSHKINQLAEKIGSQYAILARLKSSHLKEMGAILTPAQRDSIKTMNNVRPMRGGCTMMGR